MNKRLIIFVLVILLCGCSSNATTNESEGINQIVEESSTSNVDATVERTEESKVSDVEITESNTENATSEQSSSQAHSDEDSDQLVVRVEVDRLNVRKDASVESEVIGTVLKKETYEVLMEKETDLRTWYLIEYGEGEAGWIAGWYCVNDKLSIYEYNWLYSEPIKSSDLLGIFHSTDVLVDLQGPRIYDYRDNSTVVFLDASVGDTVGYIDSSNIYHMNENIMVEMSDKTEKLCNYDLIMTLDDRFDYSFYTIEGENDDWYLEHRGPLDMSDGIKLAHFKDWFDGETLIVVASFDTNHQELFNFLPITKTIANIHWEDGNFVFTVDYTLLKDWVNKNLKSLNVTYTVEFTGDSYNVFLVDERGKNFSSNYDFIQNESFDIYLRIKDETPFHHIEMREVKALTYMDETSVADGVEMLWFEVTTSEDLIYYACRPLRENE